MSKKYYVGIDGGGTKTKFLLGDATGKVLAEYTGPTTHYLQCGFDGITTVIREGIAALVESANPADSDTVGTAGCGAAAITTADIGYAFFGAPGYSDVAEDDPKIRAAAAAGFGSIPFGIGNDVEIALAGGLSGEDGIHLIAGTGSIACGKKDGRVLRCGGWHHELGGDEGSAFWIAKELIHEFTKQSDGRKPKTALHKAMMQALELATDDALTTRLIEEWHMDRTKVAKLAMLCDDLAAAGDGPTLEILGGAARELAELAITLYEQLAFDGPVKVSYSGGVFQKGEIITGPLAEILAECNMTLVPAAMTPDLGALLLARQQ